MFSSNPLNDLLFIDLPDDLDLSAYKIEIKPGIPLPVQKPLQAEDSFALKNLTPEMIFAGILVVLAYDTENPHIPYYRELLLSAKPDIKQELTEAAILKARNEDFDIAEEIFSALRGLDPEDPVTVLNTALFFDQRAESYRRSGLNDDADAYDASAYKYYKQALGADSPDPDVFFNAGFFYLKQKDFRNAKDCFESFLALTVDTPDEDLGEKLLFDTGLISLSNGNIVINQNIDKNLIMENCCIVAYLSHAFVGCGSISLPTETANGYHMEWSLLNESVASDIAQLLSQLEIFSKTIKRNEKYVVYLKDKSSISELLGKFGAVVSMLKLENTSIEREMRNKINRGANCMTANISKIVDAATKQINSIRCIESTIGIEGLSEALKEMALIRLNYPAASYQELAELLNISKSAVRQRLNSLIEIAENLE